MHNPLLLAQLALWVTCVSRSFFSFLSMQTLSSSSCDLVSSRTWAKEVRKKKKVEASGAKQNETTLFSSCHFKPMSIKFDGWHSCTICLLLPCNLLHFMNSQLSDTIFTTTHVCAFQFNVRHSTMCHAFYIFHGYRTYSIIYAHAACQTDAPASILSAGTF